MEIIDNDKNTITPFAVTDFRDVIDTFGIKSKDRQGHMYIIGKSGTGKTTLIENMIVSDILDGNGLAVIDPHGDMAENLLNFIPERRIKDVVFFNPTDIEYPIAFNPLGKVDPDLRHLVASGLISVFKKIWEESWGPRLEYILLNSLLALLEYPGSTLLDVPKLLTDKQFRADVLRHVTDKQVIDFWILEFGKYSGWMRLQAISPIMNKLGQFMASGTLRNIVRQSQGGFKIRQIMDEGKILIVSLAKGIIGESNCSLLGALIVTRIMLAAMSRANTSVDKRRPFYLYVDEIHNFLTVAFANILSESRKYGLNLILAHQYIDQLDTSLRSAIFGNVGTV
ncbi:MAG: type IV secretion system DNA-binding domain-containing protein, partial [bacterium]|nr:type IV secretion system DNA-binding domain-containing protein [bacterium]